MVPARAVALAGSDPTHGCGLDAAILDVGGGASTLVDGLLDAGYGDVTVLDMAPEGLTRARERLAGRAALAKWIAADILMAALPSGRFDLWHDRAVFHFLNQPGRPRTIRRPGSPRGRPGRPHYRRELRARGTGPM